MRFIRKEANVSLIRKITTVGKNKVFLYVSSRYMTYGLQFVNSIILAVVLNDYFPVYGFILIILQYISLCNLGVPYSLNVFLSLNKENEEKMEVLLSTSFFIYLFIFLFICSFFYLLPFLGIHIGSKYQFDQYVLWVLAIGLLAHLNMLMSNYYRVKNRLSEIVFLQTVIPLFIFIALFFAQGKSLLNIILGIMFLGNLVALLLFMKNVKVKTWKPELSYVGPILKKAFYLFLYNTFFYLILLSVRTIVSAQYAVSDFALFTFAFTIANSIVLLFDSFSFLIYPKTIHRLSKANTFEALSIMKVVRVNYITSMHMVMYIFILLYPFFISFFPQYDLTFKTFSLITMTVVSYSNCFVYSSFLTAKGQEKLLSRLAFMALTINLMIALFLSVILKVSYEYVILSTLISYFIYAILLAYFSVRLLQINLSCFMLTRLLFPVQLFIPFGLQLMLILFDASFVIYPSTLVLFVFLNRKELVDITKTVKRILNDSSIINI